MLKILEKNKVNLETRFMNCLSQNEFDKATILGHEMLLATNPRYIYCWKVPNSLNLLAVKYLCEGDDDKALIILSFCLKICIGSLGENHPLVALSLNNLADFYILQEEFVRAEKLLIKAQEISTKTFGKNHSLSTLINRNLSTLNISKNN